MVDSISRQARTVRFSKPQVGNILPLTNVALHLPANKESALQIAKPVCNSILTQYIVNIEYILKYIIDIEIY